MRCVKLLRGGSYSNKVMGIRVHNLFIVTKSSKSEVDEEYDIMIRPDRGYKCIEEKGNIVGRHVMVAMLYCSHDGRKTFAMEKDNHDTCW